MNRKPFRRERKEKPPNPLKQGVINPACKGCRADYLGYCLQFPFDKPANCGGNREVSYCVEECV